MSTQPSEPLHPTSQGPPPYTEQPQKSNSQHSSQTPPKKEHSASTLPYIQELSNTAHPSKYTLEDLPPADTSPNPKKSKWRKLKEENEARKAKNKHVTHEQAARMLGHGKEWQKERDMGSSGKNGWVRDPIREDRWWGATMESKASGNP